MKKISLLICLAVFINLFTTVSAIEAYSDEITLKFSDIERIESHYTSISVFYWANEADLSTSVFTLNNNSSVYINDAPANKTIEEALSDFYGTVTFTCMSSDIDEDYDTIHINDYRNTVVDHVDHTEKKVYAKTGESISFAQQGQATLCDEMGNAVDWSELKKYYILSVKTKGTENPVKECILIRNSVKGQITECAGFENYTKFKIEDKIYKVDGQNVLHNDLKLDDFGDFYLDILGNIAYARIDRVRNYAYVIGVFYDLSKNKSLLTLFTYEGEIITKYVSSVFQFEKNLTKTTLNSLDVSQKISVNDFICYSPKYGDINIITVPVTEDEEDYLDEYYNFTKNAGESSASFKKNTSSITVDNKTFLITNKTMIMAVPESVADYNGFATIPLSNLKDDMDFNMLSVYNINDDNEANAILIRGSSDLNFEYTGMAMLQSIFVNNVHYDIKALQEGELIKINAESVDFHGTKGDIIVPLINIYGKIDGFRRIADVDNKNKTVAIHEENINHSNNVSYSYGNVTDKDNNTVTLDGDITFTIPQSANAYLYDARTGKVSLGDINDFSLSEGQFSADAIGEVESVYIVIRELNGKVSDVAIYLFGEPLAEERINLEVTENLISSSAMCFNNFNEEINPILIIALYNDNHLVGFSKNQKTIAKNSFGSLDCTLSLEYETVEYDLVKSMLINNWDDLTPLLKTEYATGNGSIRKISENYACVISSDYNDLGDERTYLSLLAREGTVCNMPATKVVRITKGNYSFKNPSKNITDFVKPNDFIAFEMNMQGEICEIYLPEDGNGIKGLPHFSDYAGEGNAFYELSESSIIVNSKIATINENTVIMVINAEGCETIQHEILVDDYNSWENVTVYDVDENGVAGAVVIRGAFNLEPFIAPIALASRLSMIRNNDGEIAHRITMLQNGNSIIYDTVDTTVAAYEGDVIVPRLNEMEIMVSYKHIAEVNSSKTDVNFFSGNTESVKYYFGDVTYKSGRTISLNNNASVNIPASANVYSYNARSYSSRTKLEDDIHIFRVDSNGGYTDYNDYNLNKVKMLIVEYNGIIKDVVIYLF